MNSVSNLDTKHYWYSEGHLNKQNFYEPITSKNIVKIIPEFIGKNKQKIPNFSAKNR